MNEAHHSETIAVPIAAVYQQWLDAGSFPEFVPAVQAVDVTSDVYSHWTLTIGGITREFDVETVEQLPEEVVRWRTITGGIALMARTTFAEAGDEATEVTLSVQWDPSSVAGKIASKLGTGSIPVRAVLKGFKHYVEEHGGPSGHSYVTLPSVDAHSDTAADEAAALSDAGDSEPGAEAVAHAETKGRQLLRRLRRVKE
jgi:uncharacterized membrane protein